MSYRYYICDVFTETRFGGNPLAVLPEAEGLSGGQMQQIAREFNFSETTFVLPSEKHTRRVRIFTPTTELPFAGHPNVGTAFVLAKSGALGPLEAPRTIHFEEGAGRVPVRIEPRAGSGFWCELTAPQGLSLGESVPAETLARVVSLDAGDVVRTTHPPQVASVGLPFLIAELRDRAALERVRIDLDALRALSHEGVVTGVHVYARSDDGFDLRARMFAPLDGVPEDPATGSANCALAALLGHRDPARSGSLRWRIAQGVEMGRPSVLEARVDKRDGEVVTTRIGGSSVLFSEGKLELD